MAFEAIGATCSFPARWRSKFAQFAAMSESEEPAWLVRLRPFGETAPSHTVRSD